MPFIDFEAKLPDLVPRMRYELQELYFADSAATVTDNYVLGNKKTYRTNRLARDAYCTLKVSLNERGLPFVEIDLMTGSYSTKG